MKRTRRNKSYTDEFKDTAVQLALNSDVPYQDIAHDLEISPSTLHGWLAKHKESIGLDDRIGGKKSKETLEEENLRLRRELEQVKEEREILKKAAAYFAKEAR